MSLGKSFDWDNQLFRNRKNRTYSGWSKVGQLADRNVFVNFSVKFRIVLNVFWLFNTTMYQKTIKQVNVGPAYEWLDKEQWQWIDEIKDTVAFGLFCHHGMSFCLHALKNL